MFEFLEFLKQDNPVIELLMAAMLGAFLGLRREIMVQDRGGHRHKSFMGFRTMTLLALVGSASTLFVEMTYLPVVFFAAIFVLVGIAYAHGSFSLNKIGMTTELSAMITFWIGVLVGMEKQFLAIFLTIILASINAFKTNIHYFAKTLTIKEWFGAFQLFVLSGAVLPFLPKEAIDPWGVFVPFKVWLLVLVISGLGFMGYFLIKYFGTRGGVPLTAFLGSIVSSTGVTTALATQSKSIKATDIFAVGILLASGTMHVRVFAEIILLAPRNFLSMQLLLPLAMSFASLVGAFYFYRKTFKRKVFLFSKVNPELDLKQPFELAPALKFGIIFVLVLFAAEFGKRYFGESGVYAAAVFSGLIDIDAIVLSSLESVRLGTRDPQVANNAIAIALFMNTIIKVLYVSLLGTKELTKKVAISIACVVIFGGISFVGIALL